VLQNKFLYEPIGTGISKIVHAPNFKKQNWCGICAHSEHEKFWRESEAIQREKSKGKRKSAFSLNTYKLKAVL